MEPWEVALDVDDSDLPSLLRPCKRRHHHNTSPSRLSILQPNLSPSHLAPTTASTTQTLPSPHSQQHSQTQFEPTPPSENSTSPRLIPGPAGAVLTAMLLRKDRANRNPPCGRDGGDDSLIPTQEYIRRAVEDGEEDDDFKRNPWLCALEFLGRQLMVDDWPPSTPLSSIKNCLNIDRVDLVVAVIKSSTPNGFGDLIVTLKDPTGSICANIHNKVLAEVEFGKEISVGSVLILQKVAVFTPSRSAHYLNITLRNVVKVISKDSGPPLKQNYLVSAIEPVVLVNECSRETGNMHKTSSLEVYSGSTSRRDPNDTVGNEPLVRQDAAKEIINDMVRIDIIEEDRRGFDDTNKLQKGGYSSSRLQHSSPAVKLIEKQNDREIWRTNEVGNQRQPLISRTSLPEWTDEQLNELFANDCLDDGSLF